MTHPTTAALDRQLAKKGERVTLRRVLRGAPALSVNVLAFCRGATPEELVAGVDQNATVVVLSPTEILAAAWPAPPVAGDEIIRQGQTRTITTATPVVIGETVVRYDLRVLG
ncbi:MULTISPECIES: hypothetical protein [unclassified Aureimonas]|uniref:hypothetical protein n=1 Tax=unclassified Aureimonas TaxID=2615206 RepID=UPI0006F737F8|nr:MULTISPECIES: hypothetical protein [unclassified Aureimonas]KQT57484.1 hypothetical protein ASG62_09195 [Aureimonas sp. Leaf427]KQT77164.1 hypothetical protein ASG54_13065 [Aureimonas sp. Leaf460]